MPDSKDTQILFDRFRIEECLQKDQVSSVFIAWHIHLDKKILLKTLNAEEIENQEWLERFRREAKVLARLDHPNIIRILDFGREQKVYYISFEFFEGQNLRRVLQEQTLSNEQKRFILIQLLQGLDAAHHLNIIHRDVKPENILINDHLQVKLADFGLALPANESIVTRKTSLIGTPAYMSPEQIRGETLNEKTDLFSAGIVAFELYCSRHPFLGNDVTATINQILNFKHESVASQLGADAPSLIADLLEPSPSKRPSSAAAVLEKIGIKSDESLPDNFQVKKGRIPKFYIGVIALFLIFFITGFYYFYPWQPSSFTDYTPTIQKIDQNDLLRTDTVAAKAAENKKNKLPEKRQAPMEAPAQTTNATASPPSGYLFLITDPVSEVSIDYEDRGTTPFQSPLNLTAGRHQLKLTHPKFPDYTQEIDITPGKTHVISLKLDTLFGYLSCQIYPWGMVLIDGKLIGETPLPEPVLLSTGGHLITIENPGYELLRDSVTIVRQETTLYQINLKKRAKQ